MATDEFAVTYFEDGPRGVEAALKALEGFARDPRLPPDLIIGWALSAEDMAPRLNARGLRAEAARARAAAVGIRDWDRLAV